MSHAEERREKDCLNCGTIVQGRFCQHCGQENVEPHETFFHMVKHFFYDITHFDGSFFVTVKDLIFKPGFLTKEYMRGKRKSYLHPIRMYVFTSAVFFLVFFSVFKIKEGDIEILSDDAELNAKAAVLKEEVLKHIETGKDSLAIEKLSELARLKGGQTVNEADSSGVIKGKVNSKDVSLDFGGAEKYNSVAEYDSIQHTLPRRERDGWLLKLLNRKLVAISVKYRGKESELIRDISEKFLHSIPYLLFVSLPLYALYLNLLYIRRKQFYYVDHGVFLIHLYIFTFLFLLLYFGLDKLGKLSGLGAFSYLKFIFVISGLYYTLKAMRNFYEQRWGKTILKFILFNVLCLVTAVLLFALFGLFSAFLI